MDDVPDKYFSSVIGMVMHDYGEYLVVRGEIRHTNALYREAIGYIDAYLKELIN